MSIQPLTPELAKSFGLKEPRGVLIADVVKDSPADRAGLASGDVLIEFDGKKVDTPQDLQKIVAVTAPGKGVPVKVWRDKGEKTLEIKIGETPGRDRRAGAQRARARASSASTRGRSRPTSPRQLNLRTTDGVVVARVEEESAAAEAGLQRGDVIREVNRQRIRSMQDFERVTQGIKPGDRVTVLLQRGPAVPLRGLHGREGMRRTPRASTASGPSLPTTTRSPRSPASRRPGPVRRGRARLRRIRREA